MRIMTRTTATGQVQETKGLWISNVFGDAMDITSIYSAEDRIPESGYLKYTLREKKVNNLPLIRSSTVGI